MTIWVFRGTVLPDGVDGELAVGDGEPSPLPGRFALPGLVDEIRAGSSTVAAAVVNDRSGKAKQEIDVLGLDRTSNRAST